MLSLSFTSRVRLPLRTTELCIISCLTHAKLGARDVGLLYTEQYSLDDRPGPIDAERATVRSKSGGESTEGSTRRTSLRASSAGRSQSRRDLSGLLMNLQRRQRRTVVPSTDAYDHVLHIHLSPVRRSSLPLNSIHK